MDVAADDEPFSGSTAWLAEAILEDVGDVGAVDRGLLPLMPGFLGAARDGGAGRAALEADVGEVTDDPTPADPNIPVDPGVYDGVKPGTIVLKGLAAFDNSPPPLPLICGKRLLVPFP